MSADPVLDVALQAIHHYANQLMDERSHCGQGPDRRNDTEQARVPWHALEVDRVEVGEQSLCMKHCGGTIHVQGRGNQDEVAVLTSTNDGGGSGIRECSLRYGTLNRG